MLPGSKGRSETLYSRKSMSKQGNPKKHKETILTDFFKRIIKEMKWASQLGAAGEL